MKLWMPIALLVLLAATGTRTAAAATTTAATTTAATKTAATKTAATTTATTLPSPTIAVAIGEEEGKKVVRALVKLDGKPLENAVVTIAVRRTFGMLPLGKDTTLDDGTAVAPFPLDLPGDSDGQLRLVANVAPSPPRYGPAAAEMTTFGGTIHVTPQDPFPRALWAPRAPLELLIPIFVLLGGVWITYAFVVSQLIAIWRGAKA